MKFNWEIPVAVTFSNDWRKKKVFQMSFQKGIKPIIFTSLIPFFPFYYLKLNFFRVKISRQRRGFELTCLYLLIQGWFDCTEARYTLIWNKQFHVCILLKASASYTSESLFSLYTFLRSAAKEFRATCVIKKKFF